jgi:hypothetical protein
VISIYSMARIFRHTLYLILLLSVHSKAQMLYGNEWINPEQTYLKIPVGKTGFYEVTAADLRKAGVSLEQIPSASFQMFRRGKELAIEVTTDEFGKLGNDGRIVFYGETNDGTADSVLYTSPKAMPHGYYNLYSDTAAYFLTWTLIGVDGKRISSPDPENPSDSLDYHIEESIQLFNSHYLPGAFYPAGSNFETGSVLTAYDVGEGWTGPEIKEKQSFELSAQTKNFAKTQSATIEAELLLAGWTQGNHTFEVWTGTAANPVRSVSEVNFNDYNTFKINVLLKLDDIEKDGKLLLTLIPLEKSGHISVSYFKLRYSQKSFDTNVGTFKTYFFKKGQNSFWKIKNDGKTVFYDCTDSFNLRKLNADTSGVWINGSEKVTPRSEPMNIASCDLINFKNINPKSTDYLIITHPLMHIPVQGRDPVLDYADYRSSVKGGKYKTLVLNSSEVFDAFNYGDRGPQGIRNIIAWLAKRDSLKFVFLIGRSIDPQKARKSTDPDQIDMVPNAGWPGSDVALAMEPQPDSRSGPKVAIGRINALNSRQVYDYLQKVKAMEAELTSASWRKNILHLSGGRSRDELNLFKSYVQSFEKKLAGSAIGASVETIFKETDDPVEKIPIYENINKGIAMLTLFGHSGLDVTDIDIGLASDPASKYQNQPRYPAVIVNGCASGSIFYSTKTLSSDWIFAPKTGSVLFLAHTFNGSSSSLKRYTDIFYEVFADSAFTSSPFGSIQQEAIRRNMVRNPTTLDLINVQQMNLHGDPAIRIFPATLPDYAIDSSSVKFFDLAGKVLNALSDSILVKLTIKNYGRYRKGNYHLSIKRIIGPTESIVFQTERESMPDEDHFFITIPNKPTISEDDFWEITLDPEKRIEEENELNNRVKLRIKDVIENPEESASVPPVLLVTLDKRLLANNEAVSERPVLGIELYSINASKTLADTSGITIWLRQKCQGCVEKRIYLFNAIYRNPSPGYLYLEKTLDKLDPGEYHLVIQARDSKGKFAPDYEINFRVENTNTVTNVHVSPNPSSELFKISMDFEGLIKPQNVTFNVYDIGGRKIYQTTFDTHIGKNEWFWNAGKLPPGMYFYSLEPDEQIWKMLPEVKKALRGKLIRMN